MGCDHLNDYIRAIIHQAQKYMPLPEYEGNCPWCEIERLRRELIDE